MPNPYPTNFTQLLDALPPGSVAFDLGGGGRAHAGLWSLDLTGGDLVGDCLDLPIRDNCADLLLSQAVLEHVTRPERAIDEMRRILKPGGALYVEVAFMQPVHMSPHHYFNVTPHGLAWLLRAWEVEWIDTIGTFDETIEWLRRAVGLPSGNGQGLHRRIPPGLYGFASAGVSALARKPVT